MSKGELGKVYASGEYIIRQGDKGDCMYVVQAGTLEVTREETREWCLSRGLEWRDDPSNENTGYARARVTGYSGDAS